MFDPSILAADMLDAMLENPIVVAAGCIPIFWLGHRWRAWLSTSAAGLCAGLFELHSRHARGLTAEDIITGNVGVVLVIAAITAILLGTTRYFFAAE